MGPPKQNADDAALSNLPQDVQGSGRGFDVSHPRPFCTGVLPRIGHSSTRHSSNGLIMTKEYFLSFTRGYVGSQTLSTACHASLTFGILLGLSSEDVARSLARSRLPTAQRLVEGVSREWTITVTLPLFRNTRTSFSRLQYRGERHAHMLLSTYLPQQLTGP